MYLYNEQESNKRNTKNKMKRKISKMYILVRHLTAPTNHDLMSLMMTRLGALEARVAQQANELAAKVRKSGLRS